MYKYFRDRDYLKEAQKLCSGIISDVQNKVRNQGIKCQFFLVGSGGRNMVTYLERRDGIIEIDFDYNLNIISCEDWEDCKTIKETVRKAFNKVWVERFGKEGIQDSKSSLTSNHIYFDDYPDILFSIDLAIVTREVSGKWNRLIHDKMIGSYFWNQVKDSEEIKKKARKLKAKLLWDGENSVRNRYLELKNHYLEINDHDHPSFVCYIEAVNDIFNQFLKK